MSIVTKTGDSGQTSMMYGRRVSKAHPRVRACGEIDELNAALGLARATARQGFVEASLRSIQEDLIVLMGELATIPEDLPRYIKDGFRVVGPELTGKLDRLVADVEARNITFRDWARPGATLDSAALDLARTVCRRAERSLCALQEAEALKNPELISYLNRLSDLLWLLARVAEQP